MYLLKVTSKTNLKKSRIRIRIPKFHGFGTLLEETSLALTHYKMYLILGMTKDQVHFL
jgi:hypothetical protein